MRWASDPIQHPSRAEGGRAPGRLCVKGQPSGSVRVLRPTVEIRLIIGTETSCTLACTGTSGLTYCRVTWASHPPVMACDAIQICFLFCFYEYSVYILLCIPVAAGLAGYAGAYPAYPVAPPLYTFQLSSTTWVTYHFPHDSWSMNWVSRWVLLLFTWKSPMACLE